jgi:hypothetical protein
LTSLFVGAELHRMKTPQGYEQKFADFIKLCAESKVHGFNHVLVHFPHELGDNYDELIESLSRLADAGLALQIRERRNQPGLN